MFAKYCIREIINQENKFKLEPKIPPKFKLNPKNNHLHKYIKIHKHSKIQT